MFSCVFCCSGFLYIAFVSCYVFMLFVFDHDGPSLSSDSQLRFLPRILINSILVCTILWVEHHGHRRMQILFSSHPSFLCPGSGFSWIYPLSRIHGNPWQLQRLLPRLRWHLCIQAFCMRQGLQYFWIRFYPFQVWGSNVFLKDFNPPTFPGFLYRSVAVLSVIFSARIWVETSYHLYLHPSCVIEQVLLQNRVDRV